MTTATAPAGLHRTGSKAEIMHTAEALFRAAGAQWRPGRLAKHVTRTLDRDGFTDACVFVVRELADAGMNVTWSQRDDVGMIDRTGQYAAAQADVIHAARLMARGNLTGANIVLDNQNENAPAGQGEGEVKQLGGLRK